MGAAKLSSAAYPFLKEIDWQSSLYTKPLPGVSANQALKAVDKAIVLGAAMDGNLLKAAAECGDVESLRQLYCCLHPGSSSAAMDVESNRPTYVGCGFQYWNLGWHTN